MSASDGHLLRTEEPHAGNHRVGGVSGPSRLSINHAVITIEYKVTGSAHRTINLDDRTLSALWA